MPPKTVFPEEDKVVLSKLNALLTQLHVTSRLKTVADIGASVFVTLFEGLCGEQLPGIVRDAKTREDEIHNCQLVIDSLAGDVLHTSLTHISGADIIDGSREAILNLTEIFSGLLEYMLNKIDSDASTDNEDEQDQTLEDPDALTPDTIDRILESELRKERLMQEAEAIKKGGPAAVWEEVSPSKRMPAVIDSSAARDRTDVEPQPSPTKGARDTTADLIRESELIEQRLKEHQSKPRPQEVEPPRPRTEIPAASRKSPEPVLERTEGIVRDRSSRDEVIRRLENDPRYKSLLPPTKTDDTGRIGVNRGDAEQVDAFTTLRNMVEETAEMARAAVGVSPSRAKSMVETLENSQMQRRLAEGRRPTNSPFKGPSQVGIPSATAARSRRDREEQMTRPGSAKRASPSARRPSPKAEDRLSDTELTPSKVKRKVSFLVDRSLTDSSLDKTSPQRQSPMRARAGAKGRTRQTNGSYLSFDNDKENTSYENMLKKQYEDIVSHTLSDDESTARYRTAADYRQKKAATLGERPKALYTVGETRKIVQDEKEAVRRKMGFLQKIYREDLDELVDEADYEMYKNRRAARDTEAEYKKKVLTGIKPSQLTAQASKKSGPSLLKKKTRKASPCVSSKAKKTSPPKSSVLLQKPKKLTIRDDDDILPLLLEEFPHLHLSLHTWHELWRKGLTQIEQITRAHQEVRRKKTRAQAQLEEAEQRQEIMVNIMRKELEHAQRLKEIKDRKATAISTRNRLHERRQQSARSRHYYDEYQVRMRGKMLKRRTKEEMIFKKLFRDGLDIQKERIKELRKYAREQRDGQAKMQRDEIESMENYYRDQFEMLAESIAREKKELMIREQAQQKVMSHMKKDIRKKMETEIKHLQEHLVRDDDDAYFRQLDADRVVQDLQMAKYKVRV